MFPEKNMSKWPIEIDTRMIMKFKNTRKMLIELRELNGINTENPISSIEGDIVIDDKLYFIYKKFT